MKIKEKSLENLNEALDLLKKELNDETNGITKRERKKLKKLLNYNYNIQKNYVTN